MLENEEVEFQETEELQESEYVKVNRIDMEKLVELTKSLKKENEMLKNTEEFDIKSVISEVESEVEEVELSLEDEENLGDILDEAAGIEENETPEQW